MTPPSTQSIALYVLGLTSICALACSTGGSSSQGGMGFSGVQSTVNNTFGTKEERIARRCNARSAREEGIDDGSDGDPPNSIDYEKCPDEYRAAAVAAYDDGYQVGQKAFNAELCQSSYARKKGLRHGRWGIAQDTAMFSACSPEIQQVYNQSFATGQDELAQSRLYYARQERICSKTNGYEQGYEDGMAAASPNASSLNECMDTEMRDEAIAEYKLGFAQGEERAQFVAQQALAERQQVVCNAQTAFNIGVQDGSQHKVMDTSWLAQCEDSGLRFDAESRYEFGYMQGFGMEMVQSAMAAEQELQERYRKLSPEQQRACSPNGALQSGYEDGYYDDKENRAQHDACKDAQLREIALERYAYGLEQGKQAYAEENGYSAAQFAQMQVCNEDSAYETGRNDGRAYRKMNSSWLAECRDVTAQKKARRAYRRGYDDGLYD
jgi:hypothetical protein